MKASQTLIHHALKIGALEFIPEGRRLTSGRISTYFFNSGLFRTGESLNLLGDVLAETFKAHWETLDHPTVIFGPAYKGILLTSLAVSSLGLLSHRECRTVKYAHDRKEEKEHGEGGRIVGASLKGERVVIVDDVITTGGTKDECIELIKQHGGTVTGLAVLFDRQERSNENLLSAAQAFTQKHGIPVIPIATLTDLVTYLKNHSAGSPPTRAVLDAIISYQDEFGVT